MSAVDLRGALAGIVVVGVGLFGEVGWPLVYLGAGILMTVVTVGLAVDQRLDVRFFEVLWWSVICWTLLAALMASGDAPASKTTLASWGGSLIIWAVVARSGRRGRRVVLMTLLWGTIISGAVVVSGFWGVPRLIANHNISVALMVSVIPLAPELFQTPWKARSVVGLMLIPVLLTGSRAGILAVLVVVISLWPAGKSRRWAIAVGGVGALAAIAWRLLIRPESLAWHRSRIWGAVVESIGDRSLWGIGAGNVAEAMGPYRLEHVAELGRWGHIVGGAESMPLGLALRAGLPALVLASVALGFWVCGHRRPTPTTTATLGAMVVMGLFHDFWSEPAVLWWWAVVLGLVTIQLRVRARITSGIARPDGPQIWVGRLREIAGVARATLRISRLSPSRRSRADGMRKAEVVLARTLRGRPNDRRSGAGMSRWALGLAAGGVVAWAMVQPTWAQWLWRHQPPSAESVVRAIRAEPWIPGPMEWRVEKLLAERHWTWDQAGEALNWSRRNLEIQPGSAGAWSRHGRVNARIVAELGAWPATIENARTAFGHASTLEPSLPWYPYDQALMERALGNFKGALRLASHSVELEPAFVRGWLLVSRLDLDSGHLDSARAAFDRGIVARDSGDSRSWTAYHRDLLRCPKWQVKALEREIR